MGFHVYKAVWTPTIGDMLSGVMESSYITGEYAVAIQDKDKKVVGHFPLGKSGKLAKTIFYFLKADKNHSCRISATGKAVNAGDSREMKVSCTLFLIAEEKYINILQENLSILL